MEIFYTGGMCTLAFIIFPRLDSLISAMLINTVIFVPSLLRLEFQPYHKEELISRPDSVWKRYIRNPAAVLDGASVIFQVAGLILLPFIIYEHTLHQPAVDRILISALVSPSLVMISCLWWENFFPEAETSTWETASFMEKLKNLRSKNHQIYRHEHGTRVLVKSAKLLVTFGMMIGYHRLNSVLMNTGNSIVQDLNELFRGFLVFLHPVMDQPSTFSAGGGHDVISSDTRFVVSSDRTTPGPVLEVRSLVNVYWTVLGVLLAAAYLANKCCVFACQILMQRFSFSLPLTMVSPVLLLVLNVFVGDANEDDGHGDSRTFLQQ